MNIFSNSIFIIPTNHIHAENCDDNVLVKVVSLAFPEKSTTQIRRHLQTQFGRKVTDKGGETEY